MAGVAGVRARVALVLDLDPDLGSGIPPEDREMARGLCRAELVRVPSGRRVATEGAGANRDVVGLVIVAGLLSRELALRDRHLLELLGPGDVVQLPVESAGAQLGSEIVVTAVRDTELLVLQASFVRVAARWPCLLRNLQDRLESQRAYVALQGLIAHLPRAEHRLLLVMRHLADRWGVVTAEGTILPLPLSHDLLGQLAAARRSTVTLALSALDRDGLVSRLDDGSWLLTGAAEARVQSIASTGASTRPLGEALALRMRSTENREDTRALLAEARLARRQHR